MKQVVLIIAFLFTVLSVYSADKVKVRLFSTNTITSATVSFDLGQYDVYANDSVLVEPKLGEGISMSLSSSGGKVRLVADGYEYGIFNSVRFSARDTACIMCINPLKIKQRTYEGDLIVTATKQGSLLLINEVDFETYIAGVVQSEIYGNKTDIFRIQAIISRTWALRNINKHKKEGYNFCDHVHCQAYHNRCVRPDIMLGTMQSSGEIIVDSVGHLIETPFHSNSGGQTANSEDVWRAQLSYLRSVDDTFSLHMRQSDWVKVISRSKWLNYFSKVHKLDISNDSIRNQLLSFEQVRRKARILGVPLTKVRVDFQLKSTFFSVENDTLSDNVRLLGHGYGHGVGLSQEGTIRMVELGISYDSIIHHYYTGARLYRNPSLSEDYVDNYIEKIVKIIEDDKQKNTRIKSKQDDWLGRLFRVRDREEREEVYDESNQDNESGWQIKFGDTDSIARTPNSIPQPLETTGQPPAHDKRENN